MIFSQEVCSQSSEPAFSLDPLTLPRQLRFDALVRFLNRFSLLRGAKKSNYLKQFVRTVCGHSREPHFVHGVLRLLLPAEDRERGNYGLKEKSIAKVAAESLALKREDYERLQHYKNPSFQREGQAIGDFSLCLFDVAKPYARAASLFTIQELNLLLSELAASKDQVSVFRRIFARATAEQLKWITRIVLKDLKVLLKIEDVLSAYHRDAYDFYNLTNSLADTFRKFQDPHVSLRDEVQLFSPISPMLANRQKLSFFETNRRLFVETKFDGQRLQAHKEGSKVRLFSRNAIDYTATYHAIAEVVRSLAVESCVLDGEVIVLEKNSLKMVPFGLNKVVAQSAEEEYQLCYMVFDVLWVSEQQEGVNLLALPLEKRKSLLSGIVLPQRGRIEVVAHQEINDYEAVLRRFGESMERNEEGIMLKDPAGRYEPKERGWYKLKGDYIEGLTDSLDLIVLGGYFGESSARHGEGQHWTERITSFLLGIIERVDPLNPRIAYALPFGKVGTGYSIDQLARLRTSLRSCLLPNEGKPPFLRQPWKHSLQDRPDCYVDALENSLVFEVKAAEIIHSDSYPVGYTLRFPRFLKVRADKPWSQALSLHELTSMLDDNLYCKNLKRRREQDSDEEPEQIPPKKPKAQHKKLDILDQFRGFTLQNEKLQSHLFHGMEFAILPMANKLAIERDILLNGGTVVQNPLLRTNFIVCEEIDFRLRAYAKEEDRNYSFIKPLYIRKCIGAERVLPFCPLFLTAVAERDAAYYRENFDRFGDSYCHPLGQHELDDILEAMQDDYYLNEQLCSLFALPLPLLGRVARCLATSRLDNIKLRLKGCLLAHETTRPPNLLILGTQAPPPLHTSLQIIHSSSII